MVLCLKIWKSRTLPGYHSWVYLSKSLIEIKYYSFIIYTLPLLLTNFELRSLFFRDFKELLIFIIFNAGNDLLFHALRQSTISAEGLDFRVRNGIGYNTFAIITGRRFIPKLNDYKAMAGDYCVSVIPDPIPNSEVKPSCADGTLS